MKFPFTLILLIVTTCTIAQVRLQLNYNKRWQLTTRDSATYIRICVYDTTNVAFAGPVMDLYRTGKPQMKGAYKLARKEGEFTFYYDNDQIESVGKFENNNRTGVWKYYYRNGNPKMEVEFVPVLGDEAKILFLNDSTGKPLMKEGTGKWIEDIEYSDGTTARITGEYKNYERHGKWTYTVSYDRAIREEEFDNGTFKRGVVRNISPPTKIKEPLAYGLYMPDKFFYTENFAARPGIDFKIYPALKVMNAHYRAPSYNLPPPPPMPLDSSKVESDSVAYTIVEEPAAPPGGMVAFMKFVADNMQYPKKARSEGVQGSVFIEFIVKPDGSLTDFKVIKGIGSGCDEEGIRVIREFAKAHKFTPGKQNGVALPVRFVMPIKFIIETR